MADDADGAASLWLKGEFSASGASSVKYEV